MTSAYERASEQANDRRDSGEAGGASRAIPHGMPSSLGGFLFRKVRKTLHFYLPCQQTIGVV